MKTNISNATGKYVIGVNDIPQGTVTSQDGAIKSLNFTPVPETNEDDKANSDGHNDDDNNNNNDTNKNKANELELESSNNQEGCDFETAITATGYGKYNCFILFASLWGYIAAMNTTTAMSLILPSAGCDLNLTNFDKGMLNSIVFFGMLLSGFFWGLMADAVGRRSFLICGFAADAFVSLLIGFSQNFVFILVLKFFSGFINSSVTVILTALVAECHRSEYRASVVVGSGIFAAIGNILLQVLAWAIIPMSIHLVLFNGFIRLSSWHIFLLVCALPSVFSLVGFLSLEESPKFLMSKRRNPEALAVFKRMYSMNTGNPKDTFPIKSLKLEEPKESLDLNERDNSFRRILLAVSTQVFPIFRKPYLGTALLLCAIQFLMLLGLSTVKLWSPQLFAMVINSETRLDNSSSVSGVCDLISNIGSEFECSRHEVNKDVYFNAIITGIVTGIAYLISAYLVKIVERKWLTVVIGILIILCCITLYWSTTSNYLLATISVFVALNSTAISAILSVEVDLFPTFLRTTALSLGLTFGRLGSATGNLMFPLLLDISCPSSFIFLGVCSAVATGLCFLVPKNKGKDLK